MSALQPHRKRYWLTPPPDDLTDLAQQICTVCQVYEATPTLAAQGAHVAADDGVAALAVAERLAAEMLAAGGRGLIEGFRTAMQRGL